MVKLLICLASLVMLASCSPELKYSHLNDIDRFNYEHVFHLITQKQRLVYLSMNPQERSVFIRNFWNVRNPYPGESFNPARAANEKRFRLANKYFTVNHPYCIPGWRSDRGKVLIRYGIPDEMLTIHNSIDLFRYKSRQTSLQKYWSEQDEMEQSSYLLWRYYEPDLDFRFSKRGPNDYRLMTPLPMTQAYFRQEDYLQDAKPFELYKDEMKFELISAIDHSFKSLPNNDLEILFNYAVKTENLKQGDKQDDKNKKGYHLRMTIVILKGKQIIKTINDDLFIDKAESSKPIKGSIPVVMPRDDYSIKFTLKDAFSEKKKIYTSQIKAKKTDKSWIEQIRFYNSDDKMSLQPSRQFRKGEILILKYKLMLKEQHKNLYAIYSIQGANLITSVATLREKITEDQKNNEVIFSYKIPDLPIDKYTIKMEIKDEETDKLVVSEETDFYVIKWDSEEKEDKSAQQK
ncbi:MAG: GWxTD domain-containing protein [Candidatus Coatesbacteria bacterium]|nr:GWxTD domain-containing protein [Candidatus Coatesbacteria bacterium]